MMINRTERGFSYADVMIAMMILMVGALALGAALTAAIGSTQLSGDQLRAKEYAISAVESIIAARDIAQANNTLNFSTIQNVSNGGIFLDNAQAVTDSAGPDGIIGTNDDNGNTIAGFTRQILFTDIQDPNRPSPPNPISLRKITVTVTYTTNSGSKTEVVTSYVSNFSRQ